MNFRKSAVPAVLACAVLALTACDPGARPAAAPAGSSSAAGAAPTAVRSTAADAATPAPAGGKSAGALEPCYSTEKQSDAKAELVGLDQSAAPRMTAVVKLTNTAGHDCVVFGGPDVRIDNGGAVFAKLKSGLLGTGAFGSDKSHGAVLRTGGSLYQPLAWWASPPAMGTPNAACTTGPQLVVASDDEALVLAVPVKDLRVCPEKEEGSVQARIGVPQTSLDDARAQLKNLPK